MYLPNYKDTKKAHISSLEEYLEKYSHSIQSPDEFWDDAATCLDWNKKWKVTSENDFSKAKINWYKEGKINASYNCLDRHVKSGNGNKTAIIWEGNNPNEDKSYTYSQLLIEVCKFSNVLKSNGIMKGDRVCGERKNLLNGYYRTRKNMNLLSSYSYECKECTIIRVKTSRKTDIGDWTYPDW